MRSRSLPLSSRTRSNWVLIAEEGGRTVGLLVDFVSEVLKFNPADLEGTPDIITAIGIDYIIGMVRLQGKLVSLLDFGKILSVAEIRTSIPVAGLGSVADAA